VPNNTSIAFPANGTAFYFPASAGGITYFLWTTSQLMIGVSSADDRERDDGGFNSAPGIYASAIGIPSSASYDVKSDQSDTKINFINVQTSDDQLNTWLISVEPQPDSKADGFLIFAGAPCSTCT